MASYKQLFVEALKDKNYNLSARQFFEKLQTDSMLRRLPGSSGRSGRSIDDFKAVLSKGGGMARLAKYEVVLHPPENFQNRTTQEVRHIQLQCNTIAMPGVDLKTQSVQYGSAPVKDMVTAHAYEGTITTSFYLDESLETKLFFELWQDMAVNPITHKAKYYKHYIGSMDIFQLGHNGRTYGMHVEEVYPATIGQIEYAYETTDTLALLPIEFNYKKWKPIHPTELYK
jgi:hypothetical protein